MQPTYYEKVLADANSPLAATLDADVSRLRARGPIAPNPEDADFADALKRVICEMEDEKLRVMSPTEFVGVGYVYNAVDPETWPVRSSR